MDRSGLMSNHPERWVWGKDSTGDITDPQNIISYKKYCEDIDFMTIDCGVGSIRDPNPVTYAQIVFLLTNLPKSKNFIMKMYIPFTPSIKSTLYYLLYKHFRELHFYKPLQNPMSSESYVIGIYYTPLSKQKKIKMLKYKKIFDSEKSPFKGDIPTSFIRQLESVSRKLTDRYVHEIEKQIYYIDNLKAIDNTHRNLLEKAIEDRNRDWLQRFKPKRIKESDKLV